MSQAPYTLIKAYVTPLATSTTYGTEIEITDKIKYGGLPSIKRSIDATDYEIGVYKYDDISITCLNIDGYFNDEYDGRSIFTYSRDKAKIRIVFTNRTADTIIFRGIINEEATRLDPENDEIDFRILSRDSVIRNTQVSAGTITNGMLASNAIKAILNVSAITTTLTYSAANINVANDFSIDDGTYFDNKKTSDALNALLLTTNSVMVLDSSDNMIVKARTEDTTHSILNLYGPYDIKGRQNIISLDSYNSGRHRMFNSIKVNTSVSKNATYISAFGFRQREMTLDFVTTGATELDIGAALLAEFKYPKIECEVTVPTYITVGVDLLDRVALYYPLRIKPIEGMFLPVIGVTTIGQIDMPLPYTFGSISISPNVGFKVIGITDRSDRFVTTLKLRQIGTDNDDGYFNVSGGCIIGYAEIGDGVICDGGTACDSFEVATIGAAQIGCTLVVAA